MAALSRPLAATCTRRVLSPRTVGWRTISVRHSHFSAYLRLIRFDKQIGTWLLLLPCWWSHTMASAANAVPLPLDAMGLFGVGALVMRSAGCIVNDMWDRDFDKNVERTKSRPIASGEVTMVRAASYLTAHCCVGAVVLASLHPFAVCVGAASLPFVMIYPAMKRVTMLPQLFLGITFNWGAMLGWASVCGSLNWSVVGPLYVAGISWTMLYDTVYAHQDKEDDRRIGVKSTALLFGDTKVPLHAFGVLTSTSLSAAGYAAGLGPAYFIVVNGGMAELLRRLHRLDLHNPTECSAFFSANKHFGLLVVLAILLASLPSETSLGPNSYLMENTTMLTRLLSGGCSWDELCDYIRSPRPDGS